MQMLTLGFTIGKPGELLRPTGGQQHETEMVAMCPECGNATEMKNNILNSRNRSKVFLI